MAHVRTATLPGPARKRQVQGSGQRFALASFPRPSVRTDMMGRSPVLCRTRI